MKDQTYTTPPTTPITVKRTKFVEGRFPVGQRVKAYKDPYMTGTVIEDWKIPAKQSDVPVHWDDGLFEYVNIIYLRRQQR